MFETRKMVKNERLGARSFLGGQSERSERGWRVKMQGRMDIA